MSTSASPEFAELLARCYALRPEQVRALTAHYELLVRWNKVINLTAVRKLEEIVERHYCESLFLGSHLPAGKLRIADIGSGAGFPGIPVAVLRLECEVSLIESHQRKAVFLRESARELGKLGIGNVRVQAMRAEEVAETFDWVISRAVRFSEIAGTASRLAGHVAVLTSEGRVFGDGSVWECTLPLPWNPGHFLMVGRFT